MLYVLGIVVCYGLFRYRYHWTWFPAILCSAPVTFAVLVLVRALDGFL